MPNRLYLLNKGKGEGEKMLKVGRKRKVITFVGFSPLYIKKKTKTKTNTFIVSRSSLPSY